MIEVREFRASDIDEAARLFESSLAQARLLVPLIPQQPELLEQARTHLNRIADRPGFVAHIEGTVIGYMIEAFTAEQFMGHPTAFSIGLVPFAVAPPTSAIAAQLLYTELSRLWIERGFYAHQLSCFATDQELTGTLFRLGFGMTHFELFRSLDPPIGAVPDITVRYLESEEEVAKIDAEHDRFYPNPPLFWIPHDYFEDKAVENDRRDRVVAGEVEIIAAIAHKQIVAYFTLQKGTAETTLFEDPGNGQISGAYCRPAFRGRGFGKALLAETVRWARRNGLSRLYVEGESANMYGGSFWWRHFTPAQLVLRRCVDPRVTAEMFSES